MASDQVVQATPKALVLSYIVATVVELDNFSFKCLDTLLKGEQVSVPHGFILCVIYGSFITKLLSIRFYAIF